MAGLGLNPLSTAAMGANVAQVPADVAGLQLKQAQAQEAQGLAQEETQKAQGGLALSQGYAAQTANQQPTTDPFQQFDNQIQAHSQNAQALAQKGFGAQAQAEQQAAMQAQTQKRDLVFSRAAAASRLGDMGSVAKMANMLGIPADTAEYDKDNNFVKFLDKNGNAIGGLPKDTLDQLDWTNQQRAEDAWKRFATQMTFKGREVTANAGIDKAKIMAGAKFNTPGDVYKFARDIGALDPNDPTKVDMSNSDVLSLIKKKQYISPSMVSFMQHAMTNGPQAIGMSPEFVDAAAKKALDTGTIDNYGFGPMGTLAKIVIGNRSVELAKENGRIADYALGAMTFGADKPSYQRATVQRDAVVAYENTMKANYENMMKQFSKIPETGSPIFNHPIRKMLDGVYGSQEVAAAKVAMQTLIPEIAKIQSGNVQGAVLSDHAQKMVHDSGFNIDKTLGQMRTIMNEVIFPDAKNREVGFDNVRREILQRMGTSQGTVPSQGGQPAAGTPPVAKPPTGGSIPLEDYLKKMGV